MELTINISEYLSESEIREIAIEEVHRAFAVQLRSESDVERVLSNLSYEYVFKAVCSHLEISIEDVEQKLKDNIAKILGNPDSIRYLIFRRKDAWDKSESPAVAILDDVLRNSRPKIEEEVNKRIEEYPFRELTEDEIGDAIYNCIMTKLYENR